MRNIYVSATAKSILYGDGEHVENFVQEAAAANTYSSMRNASPLKFRASEDLLGLPFIYLPDTLIHKIKTSRARKSLFSNRTVSQYMTARKDSKMSKACLTAY